MTTDNKTAARRAQLLGSPQHVDCDHSRSSGRALLSRHRTSAGTVSYLRCSCGVCLVLQDGELLAVVAPQPHRIIRQPAAAVRAGETETETETTEHRSPVSTEYKIRAALNEDELQRLFEASWPDGRKDGYGSVIEHSFTWVTAHAEEDRLVGFVNVAWDGGIHYFLLDTTVHPDRRHHGIGRELVRLAVEACDGYVHVDADERLMSMFYGPCGFEAVPAGVLDTRAMAAT